MKPLATPLAWEGPFVMQAAANYASSSHAPLKGDRDYLCTR
jgi:hypothetical protein